MVDLRIKLWKIFYIKNIKKKIELYINNKHYLKCIVINFAGAVGNEEEGSTEDKDAADEEEQERLEALREAEERRKEKHRKMEEEREKMRQEIRDKVISIPILFITV